MPDGAAIVGGLDVTQVTELFSAPVVVAQAHTRELTSCRLPIRLHDALGARTSTLRRRTFAAGRLAAARATDAATGSPCWLGIDGRGAPIWPRGLVGSLSHTDDVAVCAVAPARHGRLGIDIEPAESGPQLVGAVKRICTTDEIARVMASADPSATVLRLFCAKEALYKALPRRSQAGWRFTSTSLQWARLDDQAKAILDVVDGPAVGATVTTASIGTYVVAAVVV
jgi:4'-phosphopantetheinyl transferase EntD